MRMRMHTTKHHTFEHCPTGTHLHHQPHVAKETIVEAGGGAAIAIAIAVRPALPLALQLSHLVHRRLARQHQQGAGGAAGRVGEQARGRPGGRASNQGGE